MLRTWRNADLGYGQTVRLGLHRPVPAHPQPFSMKDNNRSRRGSPRRWWTPLVTQRLQGDQRWVTALEVHWCAYHQRACEIDSLSSLRLEILRNALCCPGIRQFMAPGSCISNFPRILHPAMRNHAAPLLCRANYATRS